MGECQANIPERVLRTRKIAKESGELMRASPILPRWPLWTSGWYNRVGPQCVASLGVRKPLTLMSFSRPGQTSTFASERDLVFQSFRLGKCGGATPDHGCVRRRGSKIP